MDNSIYNEFIKNYVLNDITHSAIMLTAPWGTGKSYYINNDLKPYLLNNCNKKVIIVSLYGMTETREISKAIYLESIFYNKKTKKRKLHPKLGMLGKTIINGITSYFGVDLNISDSSLNKLYTSIDLSDKLIILEDVERTEINIVGLLGFVNSLVDEDSAKVLLVSNEEELEKKCKGDELEDYKRIKEKTISDTIIYDCDYKKSLKSIIEMFNNQTLSKIIDDDLLEEIVISIMNNKEIQCNNLRSIIYGYQRTCDILSKINITQLDNDFLKQLLMGNLAYSLRKKKNEALVWKDDNSNSSQALGTYKYPLMRFSYDYFITHSIDSKKILEANQYFIDYNRNLKIRNNQKSDLSNIYNFLESEDDTIIDSLQNIKNALKNNKISLNEYMRLMNYMIAIKHTLKNEHVNNMVEKSKKYMLLNVSTNNVLGKNDIMLHSGIQLESEIEINEFNDFKNNILNQISNNIISFDSFYSLEKLDCFEDYVYSKKDNFISCRGFAKYLDVDKIVEMIRNSNSAQISTIRRIFFSVYSFHNICDFYKEDIPNLVLLKEKCESLLSEETKINQIKRKQINYLISNVSDFISKLNLH